MASDTKESVRKKRHPFLMLLGGLLVLLVLVAAAVIIFPSAILRYVFSRIEAESGIALTFDRAYFYLADGSFLSIDGLTIRRQNHPVSNFDLKTKNIRMPAMMPGDFRSPVLLIAGLCGTYEKTGSDPADTANTVDTYLHALMFVDAEIDFIDRTPEKPFQTTIQLKECSIFKTNSPSLFAPYTCSAYGQISSAKFLTSFAKGTTITEYGGLQVDISEMPISLFAPYAPVLDDIFDSGSMNIKIDDRTDETQKKFRVSITLLPDCAIKPAERITAPAIQAALQQLDQSSLPALRDLKGKIDRLKTSSESLRSELDKVTQIIDTLKILAPPDIRAKYENFKSRYDRAKAAHEEWNTKFEILVRDIDRVKISIVEKTFRRFVESGIPIEIDVQEVKGEWQYDASETVIRLVEKNYQSIITTEYQKQIQEMLDAVNRLSVL